MSEDILKYMPEMIIGTELDEALQILPIYDSNIISRPISERLLALQDLYKLYIPNMMSREIYSKLYLALLRSLQKKQTILSVRQYNENNKAIRKQSFDSIIGGADSFTITGQSGIGKSSTVSRVINLLSENPYIEINNSKIIPCLQVQAPADSSVKGLLLEILRKADEILNTNYYSNAIRSRATTDIIIGSVSQVALNHIGLLIIDEIQNVVNSKNGKTIVGTLTQFINSSGVSICMVGSPESTIFFSQDVMLARRSLGLHYKGTEYNDEFKMFCSSILKYCYVKNSIENNDNIYLWLYNHSAGNASIVIGLIHDAQELSILNGYEKLDTVSLNLAYEQRMTMLHGFINPVTVSTPKTKKKEKFKNIQPDINDVDISDIILSTVSKAKSDGNDIISELIKFGINITEVKI